MSKDLIERLGNPFEQENSGTALRHGGSGLGLSIVKNLVTLMGGAFSVKSELNKGSEFVVDLPFSKMNEDIVKTFSLSQIRFLFVDDERDSRDFVEVSLSRINVRHTIVSSGKEALAEIKKSHDEKDPYTVCIIDWKMPDIDGLEVTKKIRHDYGNETSIIVASAYDPSVLDDKAKRAGANRFISKPLFQSTIFDLLVSVSNASSLDESKTDSNMSFEGKHVLLVEDNEINRMVGTGLLKKLKITCDIAVNGQEGVDTFLNADVNKYDLILMDIKMPILNGYEATRKIRASNHPRAKTIPILAMTAEAFTENIAEALQSGMNDHISKPIDIKNLANSLNRAFATKEND